MCDRQDNQCILAVCNNPNEKNKKKNIVRL